MTRPRLPSIVVLVVFVLAGIAARKDVLIAQSNDLLVSLDRGQLRDIGDEASDRNDQGGVFFGFINAR